MIISILSTIAFFVVVGAFANMTAINGDLEW